MLFRSLADIWVQVLRVDQVGVQDNFFELGGHSLLGMRLILRVAESLAIQPPVVTIFQYPTVEKMAPFIERLLADGQNLLRSGQVEMEEGVIGHLQ